MPKEMNLKLIEIFNTILPSIHWPTDTLAEHLQLSRVLSAVGEQMDPQQQEAFANQMLDSSSTNVRIAQWLSNQIPQITLILREIIDKNAVAIGSKVV